MTMSQRFTKLAAAICVFASAGFAQDTADSPVESGSRSTDASNSALPTGTEELAGTKVLIVVGAAGEEQYGELFAKWSSQWQTAAAAASHKAILIAPSTAGAKSNREQLQQALQTIAAEHLASAWIVLIGHGTYDGTTARFNLRGPDVAANELAEWLESVSCPTAIIDCSSSSGPFVNALSGPNRVVVAATKSGTEQNFARFGGMLAEVIEEGTIDLDKDGQISLLEAFLEASRRVESFYRDDGRLVTEHALIDDNADGRGTPASWFNGFRVDRSKLKTGEPDGQLASRFVLQPSRDVVMLSATKLQRRDELESAIETLRENRPTPRDALYFSRLEELLIELAKLYRDAAESN